MLLISIRIANCAAILIDTHSTLVYGEIWKTKHVSPLRYLHAWCNLMVDGPTANDCILEITLINVSMSYL